MTTNGSSWFQRLILPGFAFKAVVIGGGYATGRELAEFFLPSGRWGGVLGMGLAMVIWSVVCATTFLFARATGSTDYRSFFESLLGPFWVIFEVAYILLLILVLAVFGAAAGAIGAAVFGWSPLIGTLILAAFLDLIRPIIFGDPKDREDLIAVQTPGGTDALRLAADLAHASRSGARIWLGLPTWMNHAPLFTQAGLNIETYLRVVAMRQALAKAYPPLACVAKQHGLFSVLPFSPPQVAVIRRLHAVYMAGSGRINLAGLNAQNLPAFVRALDACLTGAFA